jgi:phosphoenolpyruvate synthase/pyruvate phosphate dikinase
VIVGKQCMTIPVPGGTREAEMPPFIRNTSSLSDEQVVEMAKLALALEVTMEYPVDVECAYAKRALD